MIGTLPSRIRRRFALLPLRSKLGLLVVGSTLLASLLLGANPDMRPNDVANALAQSASDMGAPGKDAIFGWGLLNARTLCQS